ncbi:MAG: ankyrin repeat domain-containing protein [Planctomycetota bacterium]
MKLIILILLTVSFGISSSYAVQRPNITKKTLYQAATDGDIATVNMLISSGANVNEKTDGYTPLHRAAERGHKNIVEILIAKGANVKAKGTGNLTPLHLAATWGKTEVAELLISKGADINAKDLDNRTPLWWAQAKRQNQMVELLKKNGAQITITPPNQGNVPLPRKQQHNAIQVQQQIQKPIIDLNSVANIDPITEPNKVKVRLRMFQGLEDAMKNIEQQSDREITEWNNGLEGSTTAIVKAIYEQIGGEFEFIRKHSVEESAEKTTTAIDGMLLARSVRLEKMAEKMQEEAERRNIRESMRSRATRRGSRSRTGTMNRSGSMSRSGNTGRSTAYNSAYNRGGYSGNVSQNGRRRSRQGVTNSQSINTVTTNKVTMKLPFTDPNIVKAKIKTYQDLEEELKNVDKMGLRETRGWTTRQSASSLVLVKAVYKQVSDELDFTRKIAIEENAAKTTIAIDGLLVNRHERFDRVVKAMQEEKKRLRTEQREELRTSRTRSRY